MEYLMNTLILSTKLPKILLIEDNAISREFLYEALMPLGFSIDVAETLAAALAFAQQHQHGIFLCDVHLPDGGPIEIFSGLKQLQKNTIVIAITADTSPTASQTLSDIGYQEVWGKPIPMATLQNNVARLLGANHVIDDTPRPAEMWDEAAALRAVGGNQATLNALREMFLSELPLQRKIIAQAFNDNDTASLKAECHKLLAACGFVGAAGLGHAVKQLSDSPKDSEKLNTFMRDAENCLKNQNVGAA
jgi:CheY-like chemotaxis protein/HPt (histidine-containing phosphotransfer) domain-containing protein